MLWIRLFLPFAGAYFLSYHFRTANAVVGPVLAEEFALGAADLGLLTSTYFLVFGAVQLPLGMLLDRFGARRVEAFLLLFAAAGAAVFASADGVAGLALGRGLIGFGVSACLMGAFKAFSQWFPLERQASLTGWMMTAGTLGALAASVPLNAAVHTAGWRVAFLALAAVTLVVAGWLFLSVPDTAGGARPEPLAAQWAGVRTVLGNRHFWRFAPLGFAQIGGFMAIQSLWSSAWLMQVNGLSRSVAADHLAAMSVAMFVAYALIGLLATRLARRGIGTLHLLAFGMAGSLLTLLAIVTQASAQHYLLWILYGAFSSFGTLAYALTSAGFPVALSGRANTTYNLMVFVGAFGLQWGLGVMIDGLRALGLDALAAHRDAFAVLLVLQAGAYLWMLAGFRRNRGHPART